MSQILHIYDFVVTSKAGVKKFQLSSVCFKPSSVIQEFKII